MVLQKINSLTSEFTIFSGVEKKNRDSEANFISATFRYRYVGDSLSIW